MKQAFFTHEGSTITVYDCYPLRFFLRAEGFAYSAALKAWTYNPTNTLDATAKMKTLQDKGINMGLPDTPTLPLTGPPEPKKEKMTMTETKPAPAGTPAEAAAQLGAALAALMGTQGITEDRVNELIGAAVQAIPARVHEIRLPEQEPRTVEGVLPEVFGRVLALAQARKNILLVGPAGCGKTYLAEKIAIALGLDFSFNSCSAGMSESHLSGYLLPIGEAGRFEYLPAQFVERFEKGGVHLLDELDASDANTLTFINTALANGHFMVPQRTGNPIIKRHPDFICIAAANTYGNGADRMYVGRTQLDAATLDRFRIGVVPMDYDKAVEFALVDADILVWGNAARKLIKDAGLRRIVSTRFLRDLTDMKHAAPELFGEKAHWKETLTQDWSTDERMRLESI